jgi:dephospho-CoA kinase
MIKIGLTGNIGSGKSTVAKIFCNLGIPVFIADNEAKKLYSESEIINKVVSVFGKQLLTPECTINLKDLAKIAFNDKVKLEKLNNIMHNRVIDVFALWAEDHNDAPYVIMESALIYESPVRFDFDYIVDVYASAEVTFERVKKRDGITRNDFLKRLSFQMDPEEKKSRADFVIISNDKDSLIKQVLTVHKAIIKSS